MNATRRACFWTTGANMTRMIRDFALEGRYDHALSALVDSFEGLGYDRAVSILQGTHRLNGESPHYVDDAFTENTIGIEEDHEPETAQYITDLRYPFEGCVQYGLDWYEPYAWIDGYGADDMPEDAKSWEPMDTATRTRLRCQHYMENKGHDRVLYVDRSRVDPTYAAGVVAVLCRKGTAPPAWLKVEVSRTEFLRGTIFTGPLPSSLRRTGWGTEYGRTRKVTHKVKPDPALLAQQEAQDAAEVEEERTARFAAQDARDAERVAAWAAHDLDLHQRIRAQAAEPTGGGLFTLTVKREPGDERPTSYSIPRLPFYRNSQRMNIRLMGAVLADKAVARLPIWPNVCPPSYKLQMDDQDHSDWMTGALPRIPWEAWYGTGHDEPLHKAVYRAFGEINGDAEGAPLRLSGRGVGRGMVFQPGDDPSAVPPHVLDAVLAAPFILITPTAHPKYTSLATHPNCVGIITEVGGALCHFAVIGREFGLRVLRVEGACLHYPSGYNVTVDCDNAKVEVHHD